MERITIVRNAVAAGVAGLGLTIGGIAVASADEETTSPSTSASSSADAERGPGHGFGFGDLAEALGVTEDELATAFDAARDSIEPPARDEDGTPPTEEEVEQRQDELAAALAEELHMSAGEVEAALEEVRSAHEADERTALADRLDEAVAAGELTAADKASVLKAFDAGVLGGGHGGFGFGGPGGHHGH